MFGSGFGSSSSSSGQSSLFGATAPAPPPLFGQGTTTGTTASGGGFGGFGTGQQPPQQSSLFGQSTTAPPPLFGASAQPMGGFGAAPSGTMSFGAPSAPSSSSSSSSFGMGSTSTFGMATGQQTTTPQSNYGTGNPSYTPTQDRDPTMPASAISVFQSIAAMPAYKTWSFEELRVADYQLNKKYAAAAAAPAGGGLFGMQQQQPKTGSLFGQPTTGAFGQPATPTVAFGQQPTTGGSLFGQAAPAPSAFGSTPSSSTFGQQPTTGAFGQPAASTSGAFGQPATGGGLFGQQPATTGFGGAGAFGQAAAPKTGFGQAAAPSTGMFGAPAQPTTTGFGAQAPTLGGGGFGTAAGAFGKPATSSTGLFGQPAAPAATTGAFGAATQSTGLFGQAAPAAPASGGFGAPAAPAAGGLFGGAKPFGTQAATTTPFSFGGAGTSAPAALGAFGAPPTPAPAAPGGFGFGQAAPAAPAPQTTATPSLFGGGFGGFGAKPAAPAATTAAPSFTTAPAAPGTSLFSSGGFGTTLSGLGSTSYGASGSTFAPTAQQPGHVLHASIDRQPYGLNPLFESVKQPSDGAGPAIYPAADAAKKQPVLEPHFKVTPRSVSKIKLRGIAAMPSPGGGGVTMGNGVPSGGGILPTPSPYASRVALAEGKSILEGSPKDTVMLGLDARFTPKKQVKKLTIDHAPPPSATRSAAGLGAVLPTPSRPGTTLPPPSTRPLGSGTSSVRKGVSFASSETEDLGPNQSFADEGDFSILNTPLAARSGAAKSFPMAHRMPTPAAFKAQPSPQVNDHDKNGVPANGLVSPAQASRTTTPKARPKPVSRPVAPTSAEYVMDPPLTELLALPEAELRQLEGFSVSLAGIGYVKFLEPVDLLAASPTGNKDGIDRIPGSVVILEPKLCTVYPDEGIKPPVGFGLNVPAEINLEGCWPLDKATKTRILDERDPRHDRHMRKLETMPDTKWIGFNNITGEWRFQVDHFSRYGLLEEEEEEEDGCQPVYRGTPVSPRSALKGSAQQQQGPFFESSFAHARQRLQVADTDMTKGTAGAVAGVNGENEEEDAEEGSFASDMNTNEEASEEETESDVEDADNEVEDDEEDEIEHDSLDSDASSDEDGDSILNDTFYRPSRQGEDVMDTEQISASPTAAPSVTLLPGDRSSAVRENAHPSGVFTHRSAAESTRLAYRVQSMKTSLFKDSPVPPAESKHDPVSVGCLPPRTAPVSLAVPVSTLPILASTTSAQHAFRATHELTRGQSHLLADAALFMGSSFRAGWGYPDRLVIVRGSRLIIKSVCKRVSGGHWNECFDHLIANSQVTSLGSSEAVSTDAMESSSEGITTAHAIPSLAIPRSLDFKSYRALMQLDSWRLASGLFDRIALSGSLDGLSDTQIEFLQADARKRAVSDWLKQVLAPDIQKQLQAVLASSKAQGGKGVDNDDAQMQQLFILLSGRQVTRAVQEAIAEGNHHLAILISQLGGPSTLDGPSSSASAVSCPTDAYFRSQLSKQLDIWRTMTESTGTPTLILSPWLQAIYLLLAGDSSQWTPDPFFSLPSWKQILALFLWYASGSDSTLIEVVTVFENLFSAYPRSIPVSPYAAKSGTNSGKVTLDIVYQLIRVHLDPTSVRLEEVLELASNTRCDTDFSLSWFFAMQFKAMKTGDKVPGFADPMKADALTRDFAWQLVCAGRWKRAVFCAMFITDERQRTFLIQQVLSYARPVIRPFDSVGEVESYLERFGISAHWLHESRALNALDIGDVERFVEGLIASRHHALAHQWICCVLSPRWILEQEWSKLGTMLRKLDLTVIVGWNRGGQLLLDFLSLHHIMTSDPMALVDISLAAAQSLASRVQRLSSLPMWGFRELVGQVGSCSIMLLNEASSSLAPCYNKSIVILNQTLMQWLYKLVDACPELSRQGGANWMHPNPVIMITGEEERDERKAVVVEGGRRESMAVHLALASRLSLLRGMS